MNQHFIKPAVLTLVLSWAAMAAQAQVAVIMGPHAAPISKDKLASLYLGQSAELKPLDLPLDSAIREQFYLKATGRDQAQVKVIWSRLVFTGKGRAPLVLPDAEAVKKAVIADPEAIGYIDKTSVDGSVKVVLSLD